MVIQVFVGAALLVAAAGQTPSLAPSSAPSLPPFSSRLPPPITRDDIVVVGANLADLEADVARCEAGRCAVRDDVIASVRLAEAMFGNGEYRQARSALARSVSRTKKAADSDPFAVAELQTARSTIAWHYGDQREALRATAASTRLLDKHAPDSPKALLARMRMIKAQAHNYGTLHTQGRLKALSRDARSAGLPLIAMRADLGRASLLKQMRRDKEALGLLDAIIADRVPNSDDLRLAAQILRMRQAANGDDPGAIEALIASLSEDQKRQGPTLIWSPPLPRPVRADRNPSHSALDEDVRSSDPLVLSWVDIGFAVGADGHVEDVEILRGSPRPVWSKPLVKTIALRRYTPSANLDDLAGRYRIERYTLTADFIVPVGSYIRRRASNPRFEQMDLTTAAPTG